MAQDKNGNELHVGDVIACKFRVTNVIADAAKLNLLVEHFEGHEQSPDDWRLQLESSQVILMGGAAAAASGKRAADPKREQVTADEEETPAGAPRGKHKERECT
jgi:hypothetical protein